MKFCQSCDAVIDLFYGTEETSSIVEPIGRTGSLCITGEQNIYKLAYHNRLYQRYRCSKQDQPMDKGNH